MILAHNKMNVNPIAPITISLYFDILIISAIAAIDGDYDGDPNRNMIITKNYF